MSALEALGRRIGLLIARGILRLVDDSKGIQIIQGTFLEGEVRSEIERIQRYGFTSVPLPGTEFVGIFPGGSRSVGFAIAEDDRATRKKNLLPGEVAVYHQDGVTFVLLKTGEVQIKAATKIHLEAPTVEVVATSSSITAPNVTVQAATTLTLLAPVIQLTATASVQIDAPIVDIQNRGDFKVHVHNTVLSGGDLSGPVN